MIYESLSNLEAHYAWVYGMGLKTIGAICIPLGSILEFNLDRYNSIAVFFL